MKQLIAAILFASAALASAPSYGADVRVAATVLQPEALLAGWRGASGESVPEQYWSQAIRDLKPIRVFVDRANIAVVTSEDQVQQSGVYVVTVVSSYQPIDEAGREFAWDKGAKILRFRFSKK